MSANVGDRTTIKIEDDNEVGGRRNRKDCWDGREEIFVDIMTEEVVTYSSRETGTFQKEAWARMREKLIAKTSYPYTELQIRNKFNQLRTTHTLFVNLCQQSGVGWCSEKGTVTATDEVWKNLFLVNKKARSFKKRGFPHYAAMTWILGDTTATGFNVHPSTHDPSGTDSSDPSFDMKEEEVDLEEISIGKGKDKSKDNRKDKDIMKAKETSKSSKKRDSFTAKLSSSLTAIAETNKRKVDILEAKHMARSANMSVSSPDQGHSQNLLIESMTALNEMIDLDGVSYAKGVKILKEDPLYRIIFLNMPDSRKKDWLMNLS